MNCDDKLKYGELLIKEDKYKEALLLVSVLSQ